MVYYFFFNDTATTEIYTLPYTTLFRSRGRRRGLPGPGGRRARRGVRGGVRSVAGRAHRGTRRARRGTRRDRKSTRLNSSHANISYAVFCLKKKNKTSAFTQIHEQTRKS